MTRRGLNKWFLLVTDYTFGHSLQEEITAAVQRNGGTVLGAIRHPEHTTDYSACILQAQAANPQVIGLLNSGGDMVNSLKQATEFGFGGTGAQIAAPLVFITDVHAMGLQAAQGPSFVTGSYWNRTEAARRFTERFQARWTSSCPAEEFKSCPTC